MEGSFRAFHPHAAVEAGAGHRGRLALAALIRYGALALEALAERVAPSVAMPQPVATVPRLEYHCDAGAPEGALYVDGVLFGYLEGIERL